MSIRKALEDRSQKTCELCGKTSELIEMAVAPKNEELAENLVALCSSCQDNMSDTKDETYWRCLNGSIWSEVPSVKVLSYQILKGVDTAWAKDMLDSMYLEDELVDWANYTAKKGIVHQDSNGHTLKSGDSVVLIKDLQVKGSSMVAKRGTAVRRIRLDPENAKYIEGKIEGQNIVIITDYVKKS